ALPPWTACSMMLVVLRLDVMLVNHEVRKSNHYVRIPIPALSRRVRRGARAGPGGRALGLAGHQRTHDGAAPFQRPAKRPVRPVGQCADSTPGGAGGFGRRPPPQAAAARLGPGL